MTLRSAAKVWLGRFPEPVRDVALATVVASVDLIVWSDILLSSTVNVDRSSKVLMLAAGLASLLLLIPRRRFPVGVLMAACAVSA